MPFVKEMGEVPIVVRRNLVRKIQRQKDEANEEAKKAEINQELEFLQDQVQLLKKEKESLFIKLKEVIKLEQDSRIAAKYFSRPIPM
ncbi:hypothetical protein O9G_005434 [Rozella allomycis CSF55]|uniref:Uncharacterized protein n=1 Tax=Rozella allomycis (strain CSF55) TaxID=988480 RepID=A0A075B1H0_ROZAC|nr:hypothetical protein O9G_005434 [Rozella allomycis CSF55]|eukprot:EPZ36436.1 hypothetical protein O9G_005434 [Rozella allomycis CSF55]